MSTMQLTRESTKVVITPIQHYSGPRMTRQTWRATLEDRATPSDVYEPLQECDHRMGHRTIDSAKTCGIAMWKRLPMTT